MSLIPFPSPDALVSFDLRQAANQRGFASPFGGSEQYADLMNDRWEASLTLPPSTGADSAVFEAYVAQMVRRVNTTNLYHFGRPTPRGTLAGSPTAQAAAQGAAAITLNATTGQTLKTGDMLGVSGLLLQVAADCVAVAGAMPVPLVNRLRKAITAGAAVAWDRPTGTFRLASQPRVVYLGGYAEAVAMDFVEHIA